MITKKVFPMYLHAPHLHEMHIADIAVIEKDARVDTVGFRYTADYLNNPHAFAIDPIALSLEAGIKELSCDRGALPGFLDDYLPDAWGKLILTRLIQDKEGKEANASSVITLLPHIGQSRIGALVFSMLDFEGTLFQEGVSLRLLSNVEMFAKSIRVLSPSSIDPNLLNLLYLANSGTGVGGARPKALIYNDDDEENLLFYLAKFNKNSDPFNNARVELACLTMAKEAGINMKKGEVKSSINGRDVLLLERFDINPDGTRNHLITFNSLLKIQDGQADSTIPFSYDRIHDILKQHSDNIIEDSKQLLRQMLFNRCINNIDDHERNFSLIHYETGYQLSPAYDLVPSLSRGDYHQAGYDFKPSPPILEEAIGKKKIFGLKHDQIKDIVDDVRKAVNNWEHHAKKAGVSKSEIKLIKDIISAS